MKNICTFCGSEKGSPVKEVEGYTILDTCVTCEDEILDEMEGI